MSGTEISSEQSVFAVKDGTVQVGFADAMTCKMSVVIRCCDDIDAAAMSTHALTAPDGLGG
jgi:hypothetical protein